MAEMFSGDWTVELLWGGIWVPVLTDGVSRRFIIEGARTGNGAYLLNSLLPSPAPPVSGPRWFVRIELYVGGGWQPDTKLRRIGAVYSLQGGLVVDIASGNWIDPPPGGALFLQSGDSAALRCRNVDPAINPWHPFANPYDFTMPTQARPRPPRPPTPPVR